MIDLLELGGTLAVITFGTYKVANDALSLGALLAFVAYLARLYSPIRGLSRLGTTLYAASAGAERVLELLDQEPAVVRPAAAGPGRAAARGGRLRGRDVPLPGGRARRAARGRPARRAGRDLALVGASGAGKTTLAKLLLRFFDPDAGQVSLDGVDVREMALADLRGNVAALLQETLVLDATVHDNIAYGRHGATRHDVVRAARAADADEFIRALTHGYDTPVGARGRLLSGGQRQRLAIARALVRDAPVLPPRRALDRARRRLARARARAAADADGGPHDARHQPRPAHRPGRDGDRRHGRRARGGGRYARRAARRGRPLRAAVGARGRRARLVA